MKLLTVTMALFAIPFLAKAESSGNLPGTMYETLVSLDEQAVEKTKEELKKSDPEVLASILNSSGRKWQGAARIMALSFCKKKNFETIGAVFWRGPFLTGVHCLPKASDRSKYLNKSYAAGCEKLNLQSPGCKNIMSRMKGYSFSEFEDTTKPKEDRLPSKPSKSNSKKAKSSAMK